MVSTEGHSPSSLVRVSLGSAMILGLTRGRIDAKPTTAYLLTYHTGRCKANCGFCSQANDSSSRADLLSRVTWPPFPTESVIDAIGRVWADGALHRTCIQTVNYPSVFEDTLALAKAILDTATIPVSVSCQPLNKPQMQQLLDAGVERMGIPLDAATEELFDKVKGTSSGSPYTWDGHLNSLKEAVSVFGSGRVSTHFIVGLGETDSELLRAVQGMVDTGVYPGLFAFTPILGSRYEKLSQPTVERYRGLQLAHYLITTGIGDVERMGFDLFGNLNTFGITEDVLKKVIGTGFPFMTSGCPNCNRPYYNERPGAENYNYPRRPTPEETKAIEVQIFGGKRIG